MFLHKQIDVDWKVDESVEIGCLLRHRMVLDFPDLELRMKHCNTDDHSIRGKLVFKCNRLFFLFQTNYENRAFGIVCERCFGSIDEIEFCIFIDEIHRRRCALCDPTEIVVRKSFCLSIMHRTKFLNLLFNFFNEMCRWTRKWESFLRPSGIARSMFVWLTCKIRYFDFFSKVQSNFWKWLIVVRVRTIDSH